MKLEGYKIFQDEGGFQRGSVIFEEKISQVNLAEEADSTEPVKGYLIPGLVDIHSHGAMGFDHSDGTPEDLAALARYYAGNGVTSFLATTMTYSKEKILKAAAAAGAEKDKRPGGGARLLGVNMEGPFLSYAKRGAHLAEMLHAPEPAFFEEVYKASGESVRLVTVAPETEGALDFIRQVSSYTQVSLGHTESDYETALRAFAAGADHVTHLYNAMPPLLHRAPGLIAAAVDAGAYAELIADGIHSHPAMVRAAYKLFPDRICLISDSIRCTGLPDGVYTSGGQHVRVTEGKAVLSDGTIAGSNISLMQGLRHAVEFGIRLEDAVQSATSLNAASIGLGGVVGSISLGAYADMVVLGTNLAVEKVFIGGEEVFEHLA